MANLWSALTSGGVGDWLRHEENGIVVPVKECEDLASGLIKILANADLAKTYGDAGRLIAQTEFKADGHSLALRQVYLNSQK